MKSHSSISTMMWFIVLSMVIEGWERITGMYHRHIYITRIVFTNPNERQGWTGGSLSLGVGSDTDGWGYDRQGRCRYANYVDKEEEIVRENVRLGTVWKNVAEVLG